MLEEKKLVMSFEPNTIEHLGVKMYLTIPPALAELIANAYDACATEVYIKMYDKDLKKIIVEDNGIGMTFDEINNYYLRIGRNRREEKQKNPCDRIPTGKKGLGKLALFGIGNSINIKTVKDYNFVNFDMEWEDIINCKKKDYEPQFEIRPAKPVENSGTIITLSDLKRKTEFSLKDYSSSLSKLFNFLDDKNFNVYLSINDKDSIKIDNKLKYASISQQSTWDFSDILELNKKEYEHKNEIKGKIITSNKPLKPGLRGISLFANGRLVNLPEFFGVSESSHFYSYAIGWIDIDFLDNWDEDVISTNRQSIDWDHEKTILLREYLASCISALERDWRKKREVIKREKLKEVTKIEVDDWYSKLPSDVQQRVEKIVNIFAERPEIDEKDQQIAVENIHELIPEYPYYHWRHLHNNIHTVSEKDYKQQDYLRAAHEAVKHYIKEVQNKSGLVDSDKLPLDGQDLMFKSFGRDGKIKFTNCSTDSEMNLEEGQKFLSGGIVRGFRNPVSHDNKVVIYPDVFNDKDCLDILSLISYLFGKLDKCK